MNLEGPIGWRKLRLLFVLAGCVLFGARAEASAVRIDVSAPTYAGQRILLYRYMDLFTRRTELLTSAQLDDRGNATLQAVITGTQKAALRIGETSADIWLRDGRYTVGFPAPDPNKPRSVNGTTTVDLLFTEVDRMDINALLADLNGRLDAFIVEDLATDQQRGMQAVDIARRGQGTLTPDTAKRPGTLFITPSWSSDRVDTFELKLRRYYAEVKDPWFWQDLDYGVAGLRFGPRVNDRELFDRYLNGKALRYDVPEQVRFIGSFFEDHIMRGPFASQETRLVRAIAQADADSLSAIYAANDFLRDPQLRELVLLLDLYAQYPGKTFDRTGILTLLERIASTSAWPEHRTIAANMRWDLTTMRTGGALPMLALRDTDGNQMRIDTALHDATCLLVTAAWCTYCEQELVALETLYKEYAPYVNVVAISLDKDMGELRAYLHARPMRNWTWLYGGDDPTVMDMLRIRSVPAFFLLNDDRLVYAPAPPPSNGLAAILHKLKAQADERNKLRPDDGQRAPKR